MKTKIFLLTLVLLFANRSIAQPCVADFNYSFDPYNPARVIFTNSSSGSSLSCQWNFGEGTTSNLPNLGFTFKENKTYQVCLLVQSSLDTSCHSQICKSIEIKNIDKCKSMYFFNRDSLQPLKIEFHENAIGDSLTYLWAFGDGTFSNDSNPIKVFPQIGNYTVCLTVQRQSSLGVSTFCSTIILGQFVNNCNSSFIIDINNKEYNPRALVLSPPYYRCAFIWDFGDGNKIRQTNHINFPAYQYQDAGNYLVCLDVYDTIDVSFKSRSCRVLMVPPYMAANKCTAKFSFLKKGSPLSNYFSAFSNYEPTEAKYFWTFGDGDTSSSKNPLHTFKENGTYTICLNVRAINDTCNQTFCETHIFKDSTVGIDSHLPIETFTIYPNPISDRIKIKQNTNFDLDITDIIISDESGRVLLKRKLAEGTFKDDVSIELPELQNGIYFILINSEKGSIHYKVLKF